MKWVTLGTLVALAWTLPGCGASMGVTTGGAQDIGLARNQVAAGRIPTPDTFVIEGLLSEHDIDIRGPRCDKAFCLNIESAVAPALDTGEDAAFLALGFSSGLKIDQFRREPLNLAVVVDKSGSMQGDRIRAARAALEKLTRQLRDDDRISLIFFDSRYEVVVPSTPVHRIKRRALWTAIGRLSAGGSTDIDSALAEGYAQVARHSDDLRHDRVILITDARPNTGRTEKGGFLELVGAGADKGIGLTVMGVGLDFGHDLVMAISRTPGANYFYLEDAARLRTVFDEDFDLLVSPVAWDFELLVHPTPGFRITGAYGVPSWTEEEDHGRVRIHIPTLFLSRNRGAIVLRMEPDEGVKFTSDTPIGKGQLAYYPERGGTQEVSRLDVHVPRPGASASKGVLDAVTLVNTALGLKTASGLALAGNHAQALEVLGHTERGLHHADFPKEIRLVQNLQRIIERRAPTREREEAEVTRPKPTHFIR